MVTRQIAFPVVLKSFVTSDRGKVRESNQDAWGELPEEQCYLVADGMGGHRAGEIASWELVHSLMHSLPVMFRSLLYSTVDPNEVVNRFNSYLKSLNQRLYHMGKAEPQYQGMGTTLCSLFFLDKWAFITHVGDSRIYRFREGKFKCLTRDHTSVIEKPPGSRKRVRVLTQAFGIRKKLNPEISYIPYLPGDLFMLCTDGLTNAVPDKELGKIFNKNKTLDLKGREMISLANSRGGKDNITLALIEVCEGDA